MQEDKSALAAPPLREDRAARLWTRLGLLLIPVLYFYPAVLGRVTLAPGDGWTQIFGIRVLIGRMLRSGHLPLWNPYIFSGMPLLASIQPGATYPPTWLFAVFSPQAAMNWMVITTYHIALIGTYLYARRIGANRAGALIGGMAFSFGGYMIAHLGHTNRIAAAAWLPLIMLAIEELYQRLRWRWVALGSIFIAMQLFAGEPQMTLYTVLVAGAYAVFSLTLRERAETRLRFIVGGLAMSICGGLLSAIQLIPDRELLKQGERAGISYEYFSSFSFPPQHLLQLIFPYFFGGGGMAPFKLDYWGKWNTTEVAGYVGMLGLLLAVIAVVAQFTETRRNRLVWFWAICAVVAITLAFGSYLPFGIHRGLHRVPVYSLFRASGRHLFEFDFALSVLAAIGLTWVARAPRPRAGQVLWIGGGVMATIVAVAALFYRVFPEKLVMDLPLTPGAKSLRNPEFIVPVLFFALGAAALALYRRAQSAGPAMRQLAAAGVTVLFLADIASFGFFYEWNIVPEDLPQRLADSPTVKFLKEREPDPNLFRIVSQSPDAMGRNYESLDYPNVSIVRGLQSANGYDPMFLNRYAAFAGSMGLDGTIFDPAAFDASDQAFNLLNVKYALFERPIDSDPKRLIRIEGVEYSEKPVELGLAPGKEAAISTPATATDLFLISALGRSTHLSNGAPILNVLLHTRDGRVIERQVQAGRDTSEWAHDRPDVRAVVKHDRARVIESFPATGFEGHRYLARLSFDRAEIERVELKYANEGADITIMRLSLFDASTGTSRPLSVVDLPAARWRRVKTFGEVEIYENLKALPRAWFASNAEVMIGEELLQTVRTGRKKDGTPFNPAETVLFEKEDFGNRPVQLPSIEPPVQAEVKVTRYEPQRIEIDTRNDRPGFLVLSEIYYRGWDAWLDGKRVPVEKVNYLLRGVAVPAGAHHLVYRFRSPSFRNGASYTLLGVVLLLLGAGGGRFGGGGLRRIESRIESMAARAGAGASAMRARLPRVSATQAGGAALLLALAWYGGFLVTYGSRSVGGSDSSGYAGIARLLLARRMAQPVPEIGQLELPPHLTNRFIPLGFDTGPKPVTMAPIYPVGYPLHMALGALLAGRTSGPFLIGPVLTLACLGMLFVLGLELGLSRGWAIAGAALLAANPTFVYMSLLPMSDVAATLWSLVAIWAALRAGRGGLAWAALAGAAFGVAFLIRPTSIFLLPPILLATKWTPRQLGAFALGGAPLALIFFGYNATAYGHPFRTGYTSIGLQTEIMAAGFGKRLAHYGAWLTATLGPLLLLGWLGTAANGRLSWRMRGVLLSWFGGFLLFYLFYDVYDAWWYTRFLLPGYPALILGGLFSVRALADWLANRWREDPPVSLLRGVALAMVLAAGLGLGAYWSWWFDLSNTGQGEATYPDACRWADAQLPAQAIVASMQMSGALRYYTGRSVFRWDLASGEEARRILRAGVEHGRPWFALLAPFEVEEARRRLGGTWEPLGRFRDITLWRIEPK